jgi:uncharacterized OB-fold protein
LIAVDLEGSDAATGRTWGAAALALLFGPGAGLEVLGHGERGHPSWKAPSARHWISAARRAVPSGAGDEPVDLVLVALVQPPVLIAEWKAGVPGTHVTPVARGGPEIGPTPVVSALVSLRSLPPTPSGRVAIVAVVDPEQTAFLAIRNRSGMAWGASSESPPLEVDGKPAVQPRPPNLEAVSQGAYIPRPTYLEDLPSRWRLETERCSRCGSVGFPTRAVCRGCGATEGLHAETLPFDGLEVEAVTTISPGAQPTEFDAQVESAGSYDVVMLRASPGVRLTAQVTDTPPGTLRLGDRVSLQLRRLYATEGEWRYGLKAIRSVPRPEASP